MAPSFPPLAETLDLGPSGYSPWIVEGAVRLGANQAFGPAAELMQFFTGVTMSPSTLRRLTIAAGATMRQLALDVTATEWADGARAAVVADADVPLQLSVDGSMVAVRDEGWREVKLAAIGERRGDGLTALSYTATLGDATAFGDEALGEVARRGVPQARDVVTVNDGAEWIQGFLDLQCPQAARVLDFAHAAGYLAMAATAAYGEGTEAGDAWFTTQRHELRHGDPDAVLAALRALPAGNDRDTALGYLTARRAQISYRAFTAKNWPIGSGCVESAHKGIVQQRLKGRGMRWSRAGAEGLLAMRVVDANVRWEATWEQVGPHQRSTRRRRRLDRRAACRPQPVPPVDPEIPADLDAPPCLPPPPKLVQDGKPTADHPWRTLRLRGSPRFDHGM